MRTYVEIGGSEELRLKGALLVYQGKSRGFVTWHEVRPDAVGAPFLGEAQGVSTEFVRYLAQGLGRDVPTEVLPENVLVRTPEVIVWWTAAGARTMFFTPSDSEAYALNGQRLPQPPLAWKLSGRDLYVRALLENRRPNAATKLWVAPYWNVDGERAGSARAACVHPTQAAQRPSAYGSRHSSKANLHTKTASGN